MKVNQSVPLSHMGSMRVSQLVPLPCMGSRGQRWVFVPEPASYSLLHMDAAHSITFTLMNPYCTTGNHDLSGKFDIIRTDLSPSDQYKSVSYVSAYNHTSQ